MLLCMCCVAHYCTQTDTVNLNLFFFCIISTCGMTFFTIKNEQAVIETLVIDELGDQSQTTAAEAV